MTELISGSVDNGETLHAEFPMYRGPMAIEQVGAELRGCYPSPDVRLKRVPVEGTLGGRRARITDGRRSKTVRTVMMVTLEYLD